MTITPEQVNELIRKRRSIHPPLYSGETVDQKIVEQMLENANWAPTHALTEPWRFTVFTGEGLQQLADFQAELYKKASSAKGNFDEKKYEKLQGQPLLCSHVIAIGMKCDARNKIPVIEEVEATACAVQNMYLTATAYGIGCYWGTGGVTYLEEAKSFFGLEEEDKLLGFLYVGMPKEGKWPEGRRGSIAEKVRWVTE
ncbi:nitroreductase family protein [Catalinimonas niigatensis]|uniref:nitroreductase family protein n=1 Tax=Catalinimonas niigatensis TaxID=1397264 RepID=UPI0026671F0D|nr:nitroreductase [Catalinimonas niigatensis]WPP53613.1 nitroreductase [Catalinimonas niigatensis]